MVPSTLRNNFVWLLVMDKPAQCTDNEPRQRVVRETARRPHSPCLFIPVTVQLRM